MRNIDLVRREAAQELAARVTQPRARGGNMPVDTGFLRNSLDASVAAMPLANTPAPGGDQEFTFDIGGISAVIAGAGIEDTIYMGFTANYAPIMEERYGFVRLAALEWQPIVAEIAAKLR